MNSYYDDKKKKYVVQDKGQSKEFSSDPGVMDYMQEAFEPNDVKAQLEAIRKKRMSQAG